MTLNPDQATDTNSSRIPEQTILDQGSQSAICDLQFAIPSGPPRSSNGAADSSCQNTGSAAPFNNLQSAICNLQFTEPCSDPRYPRLPQAAREDLRRTLKALEYIHSANNVQRACRIQAAHFLHRRGFSAESLCRKYYLFRSTGNWLDLVDKAKAGPAFYLSARNDEGGESNSLNGRLPADFIEFFRKLCERNQRKCKPAWRELLRIWRTGFDTEGREYKTIPGYGPRLEPSAFSLQPSPDSLTGIPRGWSFENLNRHRPSDHSLALARIGKVAASNHRRMVLTSRVGIAVGQYILFDDQEYDLKVNFTSQNGSCGKAMRPLGLNDLDLASACNFAYGLKPTLIGADGAKQKLKEIDMLWFVVHVLTSYGYNPITGTHFVVEHGTAAIRPEFEERIRLVTQNKVTVDRSGVFHGSALAGLFEGPARGNFRFKAPLESFFNLVRNEMAMLPGAVSYSRTSCSGCGAATIPLKTCTGATTTTQNFCAPPRACLPNAPRYCASHSSVGPSSQPSPSNSTNASTREPITA